MTEKTLIHLNSISKKLGLTDLQMKNALFKIPAWLHTIGTNDNLLKISGEVNRIRRDSRKGKYFDPQMLISSRLADLLEKEFNSIKDYVSLKEVQQTHNLPKSKLKQYVMLKKKDSIADFLGTNIFLKSCNSYIRRRRVNAFVNSFFIWLLGNNAKTSYKIMNEELGVMDTFYSLEEVRYRNSKKGRILGFYKSAKNKVEAIVGFYSGEIKFLDKLKRNPEFLKTPAYRKLKSTENPIIYSFDLKEILDKSNRLYLNLILRAYKNAPLEVIWGGGNGPAIYLYCTYRFT
ncbi:MAG: hypothetical protein K2O64_03540 [Lactobacillus sp.]|nr:hypothetical protein [Lactobacillus sp.]